MKNIQVVAAVIISSNKLFVAQRGYGEWAGYYELPGGKVEPGEANEVALEREIKEELDTVIMVDRFVDTIEYDYPAFHLIMHCYLCKVLEGDFTLLEHEASKWLHVNELDEVKWLPADLLILDSLKKLMISLE